MSDKVFNQFDAAGEMDAYSSAAGGKGRIVGTNLDGTPKGARRPGAYTSSRPSPYEKSGLQTENGSDALAANPDKLYNDRDPHYAIKHQKPEHRLVILLKAQGNTNKEIAELTGLTAVAISNILRQPWARTQLLDEINSAGRNEVLQVFKGAAYDVAEAMVEIIHSQSAKPGDKIAASHLILDRIFGKPTQPMDVNLNDSALKNMSDEQLLRIANGNGAN